MSEAVDLTNCDREPIHLPGSIQPHGCLLACRETDRQVLRCSENAAALLGVDGPLLDRPLADVIGAEAAHAVMNGLSRSIDAGRPGLVLGQEINGRRFDMAVHRYDGSTIVEFEPAAPCTVDPLEVARGLIGRTRGLDTVEAVARRVPRYLQATLGYDRVMIYRFAEDGSGKVIGEARRGHLESFLGQHFPAADIPRQARVLYLRNTLRVIADAGGAKSPIVPERDRAGRPLDLSFAHLRSVSPIHLEYLRNMGVGGSMSISIVVDDALWGLLVGHHYAPRKMTMSQRVSAEMFGEFLSLHLASLLHHRRFDTAARARLLLDDLTAQMAVHEAPGDFLATRLPELAALVDCDGVALWMNGIWSAHGTVAPAGFVPALARHLAARPRSDIWATHALSDRMPDAAAFAADVSGVLAIPLSHQPRDYLFFFRRELKQTVEWAGDPNKSYDTGRFGDRLTPRKSFAIWKELVERQSAPWSDDDRDTASAAQVRLRDVIMRQSELIAAERQKAELRQRILNEELNHRVKNILALISSLVNQPTDPSRGLEDFLATLKGRILALSNAHDQVIRSDGGGPLRRLLEAELSPYAAQAVTVTGEDVGLDARAYAVMALVFHELATNAAKYGALSVPDGALSVSWTVGDQGCEIVWRESGGPPVAEPARKGFGSVLLTRSIPFDLGGESEVAYHPTGVVARFILPATFVSRHAGPQRPETRAPAAAAGFTLAGRSVLVVEDQLVIALDAELMISELGAGSVTTAPSAAEGLRAIMAAPPDVAVLDVNLGLTTSLVVAEELVARGIPFVFATGYADSRMVPEHLKHIPVARKPYSKESLAEVLCRLRLDPR